ncbi:LysR family transcriptional regulator [Xanthomonas maliensis]|uniref:LysR family transcriptional regulator n=1 Tax=Xanthomonas maliensis TaxID=1321368 RepID=UPI0003A1E0F8|nr:LysR family transcriptional regulator [Xanthomonas maliensis]KAB7767051.1 LysR family transcriptional regulator [Xanthomonas maliensis]
MDRFDAMLAFARVVETGSFTKAAETLQLGRASVTQLVQQLETRLRVKLLHRTTRKVQVTADGAAFYARTLRLLAELEDAESSLSAAAAVPRGRLRVDVPSPLARLVLMPALPAFHARYPEIQLHMGVSDRNVDVIGENVDCVVRGGAIAEQSLSARHIGDLQAGLYAAPAYLARHGMPADPGALAQAPHHCVGYLRGDGHVLAHRLRRGEETVQLRGRHVVATDDGNAYLAAGLAGMGVLWLPQYIAAADLARGTLVPVLDDWALAPMPMFIAFPANRHVSAKLRVFIDWVTGLMSEHAPVTTRPGLHAGRPGVADGV